MEITHPPPPSIITYIDISVFQVVSIIRTVAQINSLSINDASVKSLSQLAKTSGTDM